MSTYWWYLFKWTHAFLRGRKQRVELICHQRNTTVVTLVLGPVLVSHSSYLPYDRPDPFAQRMGPRGSLSSAIYHLSILQHLSMSSLHHHHSFFLASPNLSASFRCPSKDCHAVAAFMPNSFGPPTFHFLTHSLHLCTLLPSNGYVNHMKNFLAAFLS